MRISLTGAAGIGKTTLARALARQLAIPVIEEDFHEIARAFNPATPVETKAEQIVRCRKACLAWIEKRAASCDANADYIEDRCAIDVLLRWLAKNISDSDNIETLSIINLVRTVMGKTDYLIILPLILTEEIKNDAGLSRVKSLSRLVKTQSLAIGIASQFMPTSRIIAVPSSCVTVEQRTAFVLQRINPQRI